MQQRAKTALGSRQSRKQDMSKMKLAGLVLLMLTSASLAGCVTTNGSYCDVAQAVRPSIEDQLTEGTKRQLLAENTKIATLCGVQP